MEIFPNGRPNSLHADLRRFTVLIIFETFAPVAKLASIRSILAIAACNNWDITMLDFHGAYLNGQLNEDIYMEQPPDYETADHEHYVVKLHKTLYGLKQAGKKWYDLLCWFAC